METERTAVDVLKVKSQIEQARTELHKQGLSCTETRIKYYIKKLFFNGVRVGDEIKSWDVKKTADFIDKNIAKTASILDVGAYTSEILCILHRLGYSNLSGVDLAPDIKKMPYANKIDYSVSDFMNTPFENESFEVITSISVIEHGFNSEALLTEFSRLLRPGGYFIASFDYWPEKIDTTGLTFYGMDWLIFSRQEILDFIEEASNYNLIPVGEINLDAQEALIKHAERDFTFGWMALKKE